MKNSVEKAIRVSLLTVMTILGLIAVFPQSFDLMDFIVADYNAKVGEGIQKVISSKASIPSFDDISPTRDDVKEYILSLENVTRVHCIGDIPKTPYSKKSRSKGERPDSLNIAFQAVIEQRNNSKLRTGSLIASPKFETENYGHWLWPSYRKVFDTWLYQEAPSTFDRDIDSEAGFAPSLVDKLRTKKCP